MSTLNYCSLDQAFNDNSKKKKKKEKKEKESNSIYNFNGFNNELLNKDDYLVYSELLNKNNYEDNPLYYKNFNIKNFNNLDDNNNNNNSTYNDNNNLDDNNNSTYNDSLGNYRITELENTIKELQEQLENKNKNQNNIETLIDVIDTNIFKNDNIIELFLYIFTGILILCMIDNLYKFGKKTF